jgi:hypothetical protein
MSWATFTISSATVNVTKQFALIVAFSGRSDWDTDEVVALSRQDPNETIGQEGLCLERGVQQYITFGGVERCIITNEKMSLILDYEAAAALGGVKDWHFAFKADLEEQRKIRDALRYIFSDCDCLDEVEASGNQ